jgi:hypothetical protein
MGSCLFDPFSRTNGIMNDSVHEIRRIIILFYDMKMIIYAYFIEINENFNIIKQNDACSKSEHLVEWPLRIIRFFGSTRFLKNKT